MSTENLYMNVHSNFHYSNHKSTYIEGGGKRVSRTEGNIDDLLIGGNDGAKNSTENTVVTGVRVVMNHYLQETSFTKEAYKKYLRDYMKSIKGKLEEQRPERVKPFTTGAMEHIKHIFANFKKKILVLHWSTRDSRWHGC
ncbi:Hypothetical predicted protein [Lynx pardinus]|uniref:Translationally-controlled tumor protein n=1 Tax=Lynx pardinus TaxID=191816 RepID=A0A485NCZ8_LYNPA|nr:Hypothetical predicted protein [Lynx pardinus]